MISAGGDRVNGSIAPMLGGGVGLFTSSGLGLHVGGNRVFADNNSTQWGLGSPGAVRSVRGPTGPEYDSGAFIGW